MIVLNARLVVNRRPFSNYPLDSTEDEEYSFVEGLILGGVIAVLVTLRQ
jgi:hypothetical protein